MLLEVKNLGYRYGKTEKIVLDEVSYGFEAGTFYAIVGASGAGKTTLLSLLAGLDRPTTGRVLFDGKEIGAQGLAAHRRKHISLVFQHYNLIDYLTVAENVQLGGTGKVSEKLTAVALPKETWHRNVRALSGGQQQRVAIARALASDAPVLLADEPTGNLDEETAQGIIQLLEQVAHKNGKCVIVVTHSRQLAAAADEILELRHGQLQKKKFSACGVENLE